MSIRKLGRQGIRRKNKIINKNAFLGEEKSNGKGSLH